MTEQEKPQGAGWSAVVGPIAHDLLRPAARHLGATLGDAVRVALSPAGFVVWTFDQAKEFAQDRVEEILARRWVPVDRVQPPAPEIAAHVIHNLRFPGRDEVLKEMFLNLLASAMDSDAAPHPAFAAIIEEMSPVDARIFKVLSDGQPRAVIDYHVAVSNVPGAGYARAIGRANVIDREAGISFSADSASYMDSLCRLGLTQISFANRLTNEAFYTEIDESPEVRIVLERIRAESGADVKFKLDRGLIEITGFGSWFAMECLPPAAP